MKKLIDFILLCGIILNTPLLFEGTNVYSITENYISYYFLAIF